MLCPLPPLSAAVANTLTARLKVLGQLDIAERRLPQDGQFTIELASEPVSFASPRFPAAAERNCAAPAASGSSGAGTRKLGMSAKQLARFNEILHQPQGLILVTGPTGSGKTVTLYSALQARNTPDVNICSVEDPIEIPLAG